MARRSQCSSAGDNPLDPNYLPPHYREEYRLAVDALVEEDLEGYYKFLQKADVVDFLSTPEIQYIQSSVQVPQQSHHPEQHILESGGDGSSDTYWPIHSDLDVPGLDLGWPQLHHFIGPTEVTTLVNPPEPDMPSIKEQARRLIKNAQQVIAVVMDMFTDVDIFADILNAAMRKVAVYILLDEQNADHFVSMVSNCRVNLQTIQFLRVRTVSGITYHCRSGKSFKGQMMDRFLLTDCRAVLSGNYSFMWSFEKLHRSMAHLFLGQLVTTFDEEFRILFAQSQPLIMENVLAPMEDFGQFQNRQYPSERTSLYREPRKFLSMDTSHPEERKRHSYDERMDVDWRMMPLKRQETLHGPSDMYSRLPSQQLRMDLPYDQGPNRVTMLENPAFKRHSYAEGGHGRFSYPFLQQQGMPEPENQGRQLHRGQQPYPGHVPGPEADCSAYEKFWSQGYQSADQYSEPGISQEIQPSDNFDPVLNYLSSTRNVDFDQSSEKLLPAADLPFSSSHPSRLSLGQPYACQTSPTPSNSTDQKFFQEPTSDRKDPSVKQGLRNWRISSYLSAYDNPGDEGLPLAPPEAPDPFEEPSNPIQQTAAGVDSAFLKIPNVREFKVPAIPREEPDSKVAPEKMANTSPSEVLSDQLVENDSNTSQSCKEEQYAVSTDSEKKELTTSKPATSLPVSVETGCPLSEPLEDSKLSKTAVQESSLSHSPASTNATPANVPSPIQGTNESKIAGCDLTSNESSSLSPSSVEVTPFSASAALDSKTKITDSVQLGTISSEPVQLSEVQSSSSDHHLSDPGSQISLSPPTSSSAPLSTPVETSSSDVTPEDSNSTPLSSILSPNSDKTEALESVSSVDKTSVELTESESTQACLKSVPQLTSSESPSAHVDSDISPDTCTACAEPNASPLQSTIETNSEECCAPAPSEKDKVESENHSVPETVPKKSEDVKSDSKPSPSPSSPKSSLLNVSDGESSISDQITPPGPTPSETCSPVNPDMIANASQFTSNASPQDPLTQTTSPSKLNLTGSVTPNPVDTVTPSSTLTASVGSVLSPEAEKTETNISSDIPSPPKQTATDSNEIPEPTSKIPAEPEPTPESATSESHPTEPCEPTENSKINQQSEMSNEPELPDPGEKKPEDVQATNKVKNGTAQESIRSEKTNEQVRQNNCSELAETTSNEVVPPSPQSKQPKSSQSRYQSSTANVLASSNLRDDTKLLLEQISANSQSRNEATKESPVTDDEKEGEADKNAKREKERGIRTLSRGQQSKSEEERDKLLERIQSMRKERKVYSRFEMAP
ncbi:putative protein FAM83H-like [Scophthalmus maximus]|uniref:Scaffolding anchor of CK1 domain-containing protein n=1 Tax=Scophthalmus maximus TaxID=52904 RepID=A0A2U9CE13_SCOMX|nr:putative protein FAM83H-like [Scophthalmus maximus]